MLEYVSTKGKLRARMTIESIKRVITVVVVVAYDTPEISQLYLRLVLVREKSHSTQSIRLVVHEKG
jgi:hypothetical protein